MRCIAPNIGINLFANYIKMQFYIQKAKYLSKLFDTLEHKTLRNIVILRFCAVCGRLVFTLISSCCLFYTCVCWILYKFYKHVRFHTRQACLVCLIKQQCRPQMYSYVIRRQCNVRPFLLRTSNKLRPNFGRTIIKINIMQ